MPSETVFRSASFWIDGDVAHFDTAAQQCAAAFNAGILARTERRSNDSMKDMQAAAPDISYEVIAQLLRRKVQPSYKAMLTNRKQGKPAGIPRAGRAYPIIIRDRCWSLDGDALTFSLQIFGTHSRLYGSRRQLSLSPFDPDYDTRILQSATIPPKVAEIAYSKRKQKWFIRFVTEQRCAPRMNTGIVAGIDLGFRRHIAVVSVPGIRKCLFLRWSDIRHRDRNDHARRKQLQKAGKKRAVRTRQDKTARYRKDYISKQVAAIVAFCAEHGVDTMRLEDLSGIRERAADWGRDMKRELNSWPFAQFQAHLADKLREYGIHTQLVNPRHTSQRCSVCGHVERSNRNGGDFRCKQCGYQNNADLNAANNIAVADATAEWDGREFTAIDSIAEAA
jgi:IS605 OrfB family transposase